MTVSYPRLIPSETPLADINDYTAIATAIRAMVYVDIKAVTIPNNTDHGSAVLDYGETAPSSVVLAPVGNVGRCWYDPTTLTAINVTVYVAEPPLEGTYTINAILYY
jgi:hypothetical protein